MICVAGKNLIAVQVLASVSRTYPTVCLPNPGDNGEDNWQPSLRRVADGLDVPIVELGDLYEMEDLLFLSLEYANLIRPDRFRTERLINIHFSLLPKYRGCNTAIWPILNGETQHGVTLHEIDAGMDTGPIIDQRAFSLEGMTAFDAYMTCQRLGIELVLEWVPRLVAGTYTTRQQDGEASIYYRKDLDYGLKEIDLTQPTEAVLRRVRAFTFPFFQLPTLGGRRIVDAQPGPIPGWVNEPTADGEVALQFEPINEVA